MLTETDLIILSFMRQNARSSVSKIASETGIATTTVFNRLRMLEDRKIITKYTTLLDYSMLDYHVRVNFAVKARKKFDLLDYVTGHRNVNSVLRLRQDFDYYLETIFPDMAELYSFVESLEKFGPERIEEHHMIEDIMQETLFCRN